MAKTKTRRWDAADYLKSEKDMAAYLEAALEDGDSTLFMAALGDSARQGHDRDRPQDRPRPRESLQSTLA